MGANSHCPSPFSPSGYVAWVTEAFGPFWGFLEGLFSWISGVTDNAIYPVMFLTYLDAAWPEADLLHYKRYDSPLSPPLP
jgi:amino acid transporter